MTTTTKMFYLWKVLTNVAMQVEVFCLSFTWLGRFKIKLLAMKQSQKVWVWVSMKKPDAGLYLSLLVTTGSRKLWAVRGLGWQIFIHNWAIFLFPSTPHICGWTTAMASVSISGEGVLEFRPRDTRPSAMAANSGLLLLQATKSSYCEADTLNSGHEKLFWTLLCTPKYRPSTTRKSEMLG